MDPAKRGPLGGGSREASLDNSLRLLGIDCIDIFQLHGVSPEAYDRAREVIAPALLKEKAKGKIRHLGVTETGSSDAEHRCCSAQSKMACGMSSCSTST